MFLSGGVGASRGVGASGGSWCEWGGVGANRARSCKWGELVRVSANGRVSTSGASWSTLTTMTLEIRSRSISQFHLVEGIL